MRQVCHAVSLRFLVKKCPPACLCAEAVLRESGCDRIEAPDKSASSEIDVAGYFSVQHRSPCKVQRRISLAEILESVVDPTAA